MVDDYCYFHGVEVEQPGDFRCCLECGHLYRSRDELEDAYLDVEIKGWEFFRSDTAVQTERDRAAWLAAPKPELTAAEFIYSCPLCTHDF